MDLYRKTSNGAGEEMVVLNTPREKRSLDWSPDGRFLLYSSLERNWHLWVLPLSEEKGQAHKPVPFADTPFGEAWGKFSPNGRWIVYTSNESGRDEIYVRPFPATPGAGKWMVSTAGGVQPRWRRDGKEILYRGLNGSLMSAEVNLSPVFQSGTPKTLLRVIQPASGAAILERGFYSWDVTADGQRFLMDAPSTTLNSAPVKVVLNWQAAVRK